MSGPKCVIPLNLVNLDLDQYIGGIAFRYLTSNRLSTPAYTQKGQSPEQTTLTLFKSHFLNLIALACRSSSLSSSSPDGLYSESRLSLSLELPYSTPLSSSALESATPGSDWFRPSSTPPYRTSSCLSLMSPIPSFSPTSM
ncbi:hypothetical protein Ahy_A10g050288 isoform A [Arachis hypogaea]|uniref:Uncharacterized protein n=1 Tax=Arachis hypogaea TaxID=3818 RepID=A0A445B927_ARAHY|nr:hypothetical protein Ahy_A10g050288 isoform A [Arachis hypogaea]